MLKALIVEDHEIFRHSFNLILSSRFPALMLAEANTGKAALQMVADFQPGLVFMDINLPDENGFNLTRTIKANHAGTTVIILTAYDLPEYRKAAIEAGASHFVPKGTLSEDEVLQLVEDAMGIPQQFPPHTL